MSRHELGDSPRQKWITRPCQEKDISSLVDINNRSRSQYGGSPTKSLEDFRWRHLARPDVQPEGVIVAEDPMSQRIVGYLVAGTSGSIWEMVVALETGRATVAHLLLAEAEKYLRAHGADEIRVHIPRDDVAMNHAAQEAGLGDSPPIQWYLALLDLPDVVDRVLAKHREMATRTVGEVEFVVRRPRAWHPERFTLNLGAGDSLAVGTRLTIAATAEDLADVMVRARRPLAAVLANRIQIRPFSATMRGVRTLKAMQLRSPFFFSLGDII